jgi:protein-S-isoprenylcysteine O-methyltransferase Ste14
MAFYDSPFRRRAARAIDAVLVLLVILLIVQVWLLMASVELLLAGHQGVAVPAAVVSGLLLAAGIGLMTLVRKTDRSATTGLSRNASNKTVEPRDRAPGSDPSQRPR